MGIVAMNPKIRRAVAAAAALLVALSAALLAISREPIAVHSPRPARPAVTTSFPIDSEKRTGEEESPAAVASLFGLVEANAGEFQPRRPRSETGQAALRSAPLRYVGWATISGKRASLFVDPKTGRVFKLSPGQPSEGWTLLEESGEGFVLSDGSARLAARR